MKIRQKLIDFKSRLSDRHMYSIILVVTAVIAGFGVYQYKRSIDFRNKVENGYRRAFTELVHYTNNLDATLTKATIANSPTQLSGLAVDLWRQAAFAQANLGQLPVSSTELDNTSKFLSQVGDYTYSLSKKAQNGQQLSQKEIDQLTELQKLSASLNDKLVQMESEMFAGVLRFGEFKGITSKISSENANTFEDSMVQIEDNFSEYASLIYDGPFSEHIQNRQPRMIVDEPEINQEQAKEKISSFIGADKVSAVEITSETNSVIPTFSCTVNKTDNNQIFAEVTKNGGFVLLLLKDRQPENAILNVTDAAKFARDFLLKNNFPNMYESYYQREGNTVLINYAYKQDDYVMYTDLIKVKVALDDGEILGFESHGYLTNHLKERPLPNDLISEDDALKKINPALSISAINKAMIPLEDGKEVFCYELKGTQNEKNFLVYINVKTGAEEKILILLENEDGTLTI
ncbi:MAG: germination protein YpeB [Clostridiaceae bacterium]|nr:germination protein YpeB [Clostridiaceae bacterium]